MSTISDDMLYLVLSLLISSTLVYSILPVAIRIAIEKEMVAQVEERSSHTVITPHVGGIAIAIAVYFTVLLLTPAGRWGTIQYLLAALMITVCVGVKDDLQPMRPYKKIIGLVAAIAIIVVRGGVRLESMYGLLGFTEAFPDWLSILVTIFTLLVITNAFNLIDGINGLLATVSCIATATFGVWFFVVDMPNLSLMAMATAGGLMAFLRFNVTPAKTFMGDTGSLFIGLLISIFTVKFIHANATGIIPEGYGFNNPIAVVVAILIIPLFDTIRVFSTRIARGRSPFQADRRHIHHLLIDYGYSHMQATAVLGLISLFFLSTVFVLDAYLGEHQLIFLEVMAAVLLTYWLHRASRRAVRMRSPNALLA